MFILLVYPVNQTTLYVASVVQIIPLNGRLSTDWKRLRLAGKGRGQQGDR